MNSLNNKFKEDSLVPRFPRKLLRHFCNPNYLEGIEGDLQERYENRQERLSPVLNGLIYWSESFGFMRPLFWRDDLWDTKVGEIEMLKSHLKFAFRNIRKNLFFSTINIVGLAIGIAVVLFIFFYIQDEMGYDKFAENHNRIHRVVVEGQFSGNEFNMANVGGIVGPTMLKDFPEVETYTRFDDWGIFFVRHEDIAFKEYSIISADSNFFSFLSLPVVQGDPDHILTIPEGVAISETAARKYFGDENPVGKVLHFDERETYTVTGIFKDIPGNAHFNADFVVSHAGNDDVDIDGWTNCNYYTLILLSENATVQSLQEKLPLLMNTYGWPELEALGLDVKSLLASGVYWDFKLQPLKAVHFDIVHGTGLKPPTDIKYIYIFAAIALFILMIASINFINLSTAKSANRAKEVGIKKVVGSLRKDLILQFLTESVVLSLIALFLSMIFVILVKPVFFNILGHEFPISILDNIGLGLLLISIVVFTGILAGTFPAFILSRFKPVAVLKGEMRHAMRKGWMRSFLVVFQFTASITMIISTLVIFNQLKYMQNRNLGFDKEHVLIIDDPYILRDQAKIFKSELLKHPDILNGTLSGYLPVESYRNETGFWPDGDMNDPRVRPLERWLIDADYFETLSIQFLEGRNFSREFSTDSSAVIINKACQEYFGWENPLNHSIGRYETADAMSTFPIIGVVDNFHFSSLKNTIEPIVFFLRDHAGHLALKIKGDLPGVISYTEQTWKSMAPTQPFSYRFMDESYNREYHAELSMLKLFRSFAVLAIFIGCLGLFGLSAFSAEKKTKEIGIHKVHGASIPRLIYYLSKEFTMLVFVAIVIASPVTWLLMNTWLQGYAYRIDLGLGVFLLSGFLALAIALLTVSYHAVKASLLNPVKSLRYE